MGVPEGLHAGLDVAESDAEVRAVVIIGGGRTFVAGADIRTFDLPREQSPDLRGVVDRLDGFGKPVVAAIHGTALGGGLELALACTYRVAVPGAQLGLPEVKLGVLPGAGGTQRLPRVVGAQKALEMMLSGNPVKAEEAEQIGLINELIDVVVRLQPQFEPLDRKRLVVDEDGTNGHHTSLFGTSSWYGISISTPNPPVGMARTSKR